LVSLTTGLLLGLLLGMRHALEPDHLAAVSVLLSASRRRWTGAVLGVSWGIGHSLALLAVGCLLGALHARLPAALAGAFELLVALMLVALGTRAIVRSRSRPRGAGHGDIVPVDRWTLARRPLVVGLIHGLAGSGALSTLVMVDMPSVSMRIAYMALFGVGSILGMAFLTGVAGWPLAGLGRSPRFSRGLSAVTGAISVLLGGWWGWSAVRGYLQS
jgi:hypothetical protein